MNMKFVIIIAIVYLTFSYADMSLLEDEQGDIILDQQEKTQRSKIMDEEIIDPFKNFYTTFEKIAFPMRNILSIIYNETPKRRTSVLKNKMDKNIHTEKENVFRPKIILHSKKQNLQHKPKDVKLVKGTKRFFNPFMRNMNELCKRQFSPMCNNMIPILPCNGPGCAFNNDISSSGCPPGMPNCILTPVFPNSFSKANGVLFIPKDCPPNSQNCITGNQIPLPQPTTQRPITPISHISAENSIPLPPATVELKIEPKSDDLNMECCSSSCKNDDKCIMFHGKKYRLVPYDSNPCIGPECSDFVDYSNIIQRALPVPEDCISTLKDMDFSSSTLHHAPLCQKATVKVVINLGRSLGQLLKALNQIYNIGGCSLSPRDTKLIARAVHQLLLNGCCSPTGGNIIKIGGGCKK